MNGYRASGIEYGKDFFEKGEQDEYSGHKESARANFEQARSIFSVCRRQHPEAERWFNKVTNKLAILG